MNAHHNKSLGQALTEVLTYTGLLGIAAIVVVTLYGKQIRSGMSAITGGMSGGEAEVVSLGYEASSAASMDADTGNYSPYTGSGSGYMGEDAGYLYTHEKPSIDKLETPTTASGFGSLPVSETSSLNQSSHLDELESQTSAASSGLTDRKKEIQQMIDDAARENARLFAESDQVFEDHRDNIIDAFFNAAKATVSLAKGDVAGLTANVGKLTGNLAFAVGNEDLAADIKIAGDAFDLFSGLQVDPPHKVLSKVSNVTSGLSDKLIGQNHVVSRNLHEANRWIKTFSVVGDGLNLTNDHDNIIELKNVLKQDEVTKLLESNYINSVGNLVDGIRVLVQ